MPINLFFFYTAQANENVADDINVPEDEGKYLLIIPQ